MSGRGTETEIKLRLDNAEVGRKLLRAAGFRVTRRRVFETNTVFDTPDHVLKRSGRLLRIRSAGSRSTLTYKGPARQSQFKSRVELEVAIDEPQAAAAIFKNLGFIATLKYEKYRTEYRGHHRVGVVMLDETPIGVFLEIEGPPAWIRQTAQHLGFTSRDFIRSSYSALYEEYCRERKLKRRNMIFHSSRRPQSKAKTKGKKIP